MIVPVVPAPRLRPAGDGALWVELGTRIDPALHRRAVALWHALQRDPPPGLVDVAPGYAGVLVVWDPRQVQRAAVVRAVARHLGSQGVEPAARAREVTLPVVYGGPFGPDLDFVATQTGLSPDAVVALHAGAEYTVYITGFLPGFAYLGGMPPALRVPRLATPRLRVPEGAVGIGGEQTGVYAIGGNPGGWRIIGQTWVPLWDPAASPPARLQPGDRVRFVAVDRARAPAEWVARAQAFDWELAG